MYSKEENLEKIENICNLSFKELNNQIYHECIQRGELLQNLWDQKELIFKKKVENFVSELSQTEKNSKRNFLICETQLFNEIEQKNKEIDKVSVFYFIFIKIFYFYKNFLFLLRFPMIRWN